MNTHYHMLFVSTKGEITETPCASWRPSMRYWVLRNGETHVWLVAFSISLKGAAIGKLRDAVNVAVIARAQALGARAWEVQTARPPAARAKRVPEKQKRLF